jgi:hypothetical protein
MSINPLCIPFPSFGSLLTIKEWLCQSTKNEKPAKKDCWEFIFTG